MHPINNNNNRVNRRSNQNGNEIDRVRRDQAQRPARPQSRAAQRADGNNENVAPARMVVAAPQQAKPIKVLGPIVEANNYPEECVTPVVRRDLVISHMGTDDNEGTGNIDMRVAGTRCVFCTETNAIKELFSCEGHVNGTGKKEPCRMKFHLDCAQKYNHGSFLFHYAALPECQDKMLCPLHCCSACNVDHRMQSSYDGPMIECIECLRAYHVDTCLPVGSRTINIDLNLEGKTYSIPMIVCPAHFDQKSTVKVHTRVCTHCADVEHELVKCRTCVRSFHPPCIEMETLNGMPRNKNICEHCLSDDVLRFNVPVVARWKKTFHLAYTRSWEECPEELKLSPKYRALGYTLVEWASNKTKSIASIRDMTRLEVQYRHMAPAGTQDTWKEMSEQFLETEFDSFPTLYKRAPQMRAASKHYGSAKKKPLRYHERGLCNCNGPNRCTTEACCYVADGHECPPECSLDGRVCNNRKVSEKRVNEKMEIRKAGKKGFGVFATAPIKRGEYLAEYVGEIICKAEKNLRIKNNAISRDTQANKYMMDLHNSITVDAARIGNITRFINHSCNPNGRSVNIKVWVKSLTTDSLYENRGFIEATEDIAKDEEITFHYGDGYDFKICYCMSKDCPGKFFGQKKKAADDVGTSSDAEDSDSDDEPAATPATPPQPRKRRRLTDAQEAPAKRRRIEDEEDDQDASAQPARKSDRVRTVPAKYLD